MSPSHLLRAGKSEREVKGSHSEMARRAWGFRLRQDLSVTLYEVYVCFKASPCES